MTGLDTQADQLMNTTPVVDEELDRLELLREYYETRRDGYQALLDATIKRIQEAHKTKMNPKTIKASNTETINHGTE